MKILRRFTSMRVRTSDDRYRHMVVTTVTSQDQVTGRVGLPSSKKTVTATRQPSTDTRGEEFVQ
jgi:ribosomal protein S10